MIFEEPGGHRVDVWIPEGYRRRTGWMLMNIGVALDVWTPEGQDLGAISRKRNFIQGPSRKRSRDFGALCGLKIIVRYVSEPLDTVGTF